MQRAAASMRAAARVFAGPRATPLSSAAAASASAHFALATAAAWRSPLASQHARGICSRAIGVAQRAEQAQRRAQQQRTVDNSAQPFSLRYTASSAAVAAGAAGAGASGAAGAGAAGAAGAPTPPTPAVEPTGTASHEIVAASDSSEPLTSFGGPLNPENVLSKFPEVAQDLLCFVHSTTGLPWWASIILMTVATRACFVHPLATGQLRATMGLQTAAPELKQLGNDMEADKASYASRSQPVPVHVTTEWRVRRAEIQKRHGWSMGKQFRSALFSIPVFMSFFWGLRAMAHKDPSFCTGGFTLGSLDFTNLAELDSTWVLPVMNGLGMALTIHLNSENQPQRFKKFMLAFAAVSVWFTASAVPSGVLLYWITQNLFLAAQGQVLKRPAVRRFFDIPVVTLSAAEKEEARRKADQQIDKLWAMAKGQAADKAVARSAGAATNPFTQGASFDPNTGMPTNPFAAPPAPAAVSAAAPAASTSRVSPAAASFYTTKKSQNTATTKAKQATRKR